MSDSTWFYHRISSSTQRLPRCCICNVPVLLETSKTDEHGQALHEECYVLKVCRKEEYYVLKLWWRAEFLNEEGIYVGPRQRSTRSGSLAKPRGQRTGSRQYQTVRRACNILMHRAKHVYWHKRPWNLDLAAVITILLLSCWIAYGDHLASSLGWFDLQRSIAIEQQGHPPAPKGLLARGRLELQTVPVSAKHANTATFFPRVGDAENEVIHIGEDVTVRYFTAKLAPRPGPVGKYQVVHIGEDVTVRYLTALSRHTRN
jgi:hypothetical protein